MANTSPHQGRQPHRNPAPNPAGRGPETRNWPGNRPGRGSGPRAHRFGPGPEPRSGAGGSLGQALRAIGARLVEALGTCARLGRGERAPGPRSGPGKRGPPGSRAARPEAGPGARRASGLTGPEPETRDRPAGAKGRGRAPNPVGRGRIGSTRGPSNAPAGSPSRGGPDRLGPGPGRRPKTRDRPGHPQAASRGPGGGEPGGGFPPWAEVGGWGTYSAP
ncbi:large adhesin [Streptomyces malaysiensis subsp. malaysiensis]|nr:large adhesin [Streptomyces malaysiensis]